MRAKAGGYVKLDKVGGDVTNLVNHRVAVIFFAVSVFSIYWLGIKKRERAAYE